MEYLANQQLEEVLAGTILTREGLEEEIREAKDAIYLDKNRQ